MTIASFTREVSICGDWLCSDRSCISGAGTLDSSFAHYGHERTSDLARSARSLTLIHPHPGPSHPSPPWPVAYAENSARVFAFYPNCPCSSHGTIASGACTCDADYGLSDCSVHCPSSGVSTFCSSHGTCDASLGASMTEYICECVSGYAGSDCSIECPGGADSPCSGHGTCSEDSATVRRHTAVAFFAIVASSCFDTVGNTTAS